MKNKDLKILDNLLEKLKLSSEILISKRGYYIYYNEPTKATKNVKIHTHDCGFCAWGSGRGIDTKESGKNGVWVGPFNNLKQARIFAENILNSVKISNHGCIDNKKNIEKQY